MFDDIFDEPKPSGKVRQIVQKGNQPQTETIPHILLLSFNWIVFVSREEKRAQIMVEK